MTSTTTTATTDSMNNVQSVTIEKGVGFILTPDMLAKLGVQEGDTVLIKTTSTGIRITPGTLAIARRVMREDKDLLRRLAE